jgi:uncharacterized membrane protein YoaK (UPF0700 family)
MTNRHLMKRRAWRPRRPIALTMALIGALAASVAFSASVQAAPRATTPLGRTAKFLGVWN